MTTVTEPSVFAKIVDRLRNKSDEELTLLYNKLFENELLAEWQSISAEANFGDATDEDIVKAIQAKRYRPHA